ncbi:hypothetical protein [Bacillus sp. UNC437CL72CviS29]|uniref:hypothetical protein n=1 Tax=Bacillus sp. UNC437CL72CviS29 TaxID=1340430 RepID=UPI00047BB122|nr:hypothetical protein [Bacillus sp. UNC437CL72CviS29]
MAQFKKGAAALGALNTQSEGGSTLSAEFAKFNVGTTYKVRVLGTEDLIQFFSYGIFKKVNSFVAKNPSVRNEKGFVESNHTAWDLAAQFHYDEAKKLEEGGADQKVIDDKKNEAYKYVGKERYALGFINLEDSKEIIIDLSRNQAKEVYAVIAKYEKKLGRLAFELSKTNATGLAKDTKITLTPFIDMEEDLTDKERANFAKWDDKEFNAKLFDGLLFEADEKTQIENLVAAGFDISKIGLTLENGGNEAPSDEGTPIEIDDDSLPF